MKKVLIPVLVFIALAFGIYHVLGLFSAKPPTPIITVGGKKVDVAQGSYCWDGFLNSVCADTSSPPEMIKHQQLKPVLVSPQSQLKIEFNKEPKDHSLSVNQWLPNGKTENVPINDHRILLPKEKGIYVYDVSATWDRGSSSYAFFIEVR